MLNKLDNGEVKEVAMTVEKQLIVKGREEGIGIGRKEGIGIGRKEGIGIGRKEGIKDVARNMKSKHANINDIIDFTGLSKEEIDKL